MNTRDDELDVDWLQFIATQPPGVKRSLWEAASLLRWAPWITLGVSSVVTILAGWLASEPPLPVLSPHNDKPEAIAFEAPDAPDVRDEDWAAQYLELLADRKD